MANWPLRLPLEIQHWASIIMDNTCRKDMRPGGIRQCANSVSHVFYPAICCLMSLMFSCSAMWTMEDISKIICKMSTMLQSQILWEGVSEYDMG
jgi:hypothetical protein